MNLTDSDSSDWPLPERGSVDRAVESVVGLSRLLWELAAAPADEGKHKGRAAVAVAETDLRERAARSVGDRPGAADEAAAILERLLALGLAERPQPGVLAFHLSTLQPIGLVRRLLGGLAPDHQLRYFAMRSIRTHYQCALSSPVAHLFHLLADVLNSILEEASQRQRNRSPERYKVELDYEAEVLRPLEALLARTPSATQDPAASARFFLECCRAVRYIKAEYTTGRVTAYTRRIDSEYLLSCLFGLSTGIRGFDDLFGGGGLMLVDNLVDSSEQRLCGRTVLTMGRYATGKTLLALQVALEVAAKGGIGWYMGFEQSAAECLYTLRTMCSLDLDRVAIATDPPAAERLLDNPEPDRGALIFLRTVKESFDQFLTSFNQNAQRMQRYPLRLIVVDPINAIFREDEITLGRSRVLRMFEEAKRLGANVWLVAEEDGDAENRTLYEQNIADTVIHLSLKEKRGYVQRYMEVAKSRLQREQRGKHPYEICAGTGVTVYPASAAVDERIRSRTPREPKKGIPYGLGTLDHVLGKDAITVGDVVLLEGPPGSLKTRLGLQFLVGSPPSRHSGQHVRNLLVTTRDEDTNVKWALGEGSFVQSRDAFARLGGEVRVLSLRSGYVHPGYVIQQIETALLDARLDGFAVDRLMVDNVAHWEMTCPFIREDEIFGDTLLEVLRRNGVTSLLTCTRIVEKRRSNLLQSVVDNSNCIIQLDRIQFRGAHTTMLRVLKTRRMSHRRESFGVVLAKHGVRVERSFSLLRVQPGGATTPVGVRLFLHSETDMQKHYNEFTLSTVQAVLQSNAELAVQDQIYMGRAFALASASAVDELQLLQLDEFQVPAHNASHNGDSRLYEFSDTDVQDGKWREQWREHYPRFIRRRGGRYFSVLPFYANPSLLAFRPKWLSDPQAVTDWRRLAEQCLRWERENPPGKMFFDFPGGTQENYNCLFLEILLSLTGAPPVDRRCGLSDWLLQSEAIEAAKLFRALCRRAYFSRGQEKDSHVEREIRMNSEAVVWRTWYSTLNQLMLSLPRSDRQQIEVAPLPNNVSISGEWYLGIPAYSAAPDVGLKLIRFLTSREAELDRMRNGVGLPTRRSFYESSQCPVNTRVSPYFSMDLRTLGTLVEDAFPRSSFQCYGQFSGFLCSHLQDIIELPDTADIDSDVERLFGSLREKIAFLQHEGACNRCTSHRGTR